MPASVTIEGGGSGSYLDCFSDAFLEPPTIAVYNPGVLGLYLVLVIPQLVHGPEAEISLIGTTSGDKG